jgi:hypothetical protein
LVWCEILLVSFSFRHAQLQPSGCTAYPRKARPNNLSARWNDSVAGRLYADQVGNTYTLIRSTVTACCTPRQARYGPAWSAHFAFISLFCFFFISAFFLQHFYEFEFCSDLKNIWILIFEFFYRFINLFRFLKFSNLKLFQLVILFWFKFCYDSKFVQF